MAALEQAIQDIDRPQLAGKRLIALPPLEAKPPLLVDSAKQATPTTSFGNKIDPRSIKMASVPLNGSHRCIGRLFCSRVPLWPC